MAPPAKPAPTIEELGKKYPGYAFRYHGARPTRKHAILLATGSIGSADTISVGPYRSAECGNGPLWYSPKGWQGTGTQEEYDLNDQLAVCKRCLVKLDGGSFGVGLADKMR